MRCSMSKKLTPKQQAFCDEYLIDLNATQAAVRAGYSKKTAGRIGQENLQKPVIQESIKANMEKRSERTEVTADRVLKELAKVAFADLKDFVTWDDYGVKIINSDKVDGTMLAEISETINNTILPNGTEIEKKQRKVKPHDKMKALEMLGKHLGMFKDNVNITGEMAIQFVDDIGDENDE